MIERGSLYAAHGEAPVRDRKTPGPPREGKASFGHALATASARPTSKPSPAASRTSGESDRKVTSAADGRRDRKVAFPTTASDAGLATDPGSECDPKVAFAPGRESDPKVAFAPGRESDPRVAFAPDGESDPKVAFALDGESDPKVAFAPGRESDPKVAFAPGRESDPKVAFAPGRGCDPKVASGARVESDLQVAFAPGGESDPKVASGARVESDLQVAFHDTAECDRKVAFGADGAMSELTAAPEREAWMPFLFAAEPGAEDEAAAVRPGVLLLGVEVERDDGEDVPAMDPPAQMAAGHAVVASVGAEKPAEAPGSMADRVREALEVKPEPAGAAVTAHARVVFGDGETSVSVAVRAHDDHVFVRATAGGDMAAAFVAHADELRVALRRHGLDLAEVSAQTRPGQDDGRPRGERREERPNQEEQQPRRRGEERT